MRQWVLIIAILLLTIAALGAANRPAQIPARDIGKGTLILGDLGVPVGRTVKIRGTKKRAGPNPNCFYVSDLNGEKFEAAKGRPFVSCPQLQDWPEGTEAVLMGYEIGELRYLNDHDGSFDENDPRFRPQQRVFLHFVATKVIEPKDLELEPRQQK